VERSRYDHPHAASGHMFSECKSIMSRTFAPVWILLIPQVTTRTSVQVTCQQIDLMSNHMSANRLHVKSHVIKGTSCQITRTRRSMEQTSPSCRSSLERRQISPSCDEISKDLRSLEMRIGYRRLVGSEAASTQSQSGRAEPEGHGTWEDNREVVSRLPSPCFGDESVETRCSAKSSNVRPDSHRVRGSIPRSAGGEVT
jgi:hypothetical protein